MRPYTYVQSEWRTLVSYHKDGKYIYLLRQSSIRHQQGLYAVRIMPDDNRYPIITKAMKSRKEAETLYLNPQEIYHWINSERSV